MLPNYAVIDYETADATGLGSTSFWLPGFKVVSAAIAWTIAGKLHTYWSKDPWLAIKNLADNNIPIIAHNICFEMAVTEICYPNYKLSWYADTLRLSALYDGGAPEEITNDENDEIEYINDGLSLEACGKRILGESDSKDEADRLIKELFPEAHVDEYGKYKPCLPDKDLEKYNIGDTVLTLKLFQKITKAFEEEGYDWSFDHTIYLHECKLINDAQRRGILVDRNALRRYYLEIEDEVKNIDCEFKKVMAEPIARVEDTKWAELKAKYKTEKGANNCPRPVFNPGSKTQLAKLFVNTLGIKPEFYTDKGAPSFKTNHVHQFGEGGLILQNRGKRLIIANQAKKILSLSEPDEKWHMSIRATGTATGRGAGEGGVNGQGLGRRDLKLMSALLAPKGKRLFSMDLSAGEPTLITHFSGDRLYRAATFDMVGKTPYMDDGILMIGDVYLMVGSVSPFAKELLDAWQYAKFNGRSMAEQWTVDPDVVTKYLKNFRKFIKMICLALGYGLGPKKMVLHAQKNGYTITLKQAKEFYYAYWDLFSGVKSFGKKLEKEFESKGKLYTAFGYRLVPAARFKSLNYFIQGSVSGLMNLINMQMFNQESPCEFVGLIHDEDLGQYDIGRDQEALDFKNKVMEDINRQLGWSVKVRTGWAVGNNFYQAK